MPEHNKKIKRRIRKTTLPGQAKVLAVALLGLALAVGISVSGEYARLALKNYQITQLKRDIVAKKVENDQLQLEIDKLQSVSRIESIATNQLGMVKPANYAFIDSRADAKTKVSTVGDATLSQPDSVAQKPSGNPVISQVAQIFTNLFGTE